ncbi:MAG: hypothetical protein R3F65_23580 [bacterium]
MQLDDVLQVLDTMNRAGETAVALDDDALAALAAATLPELAAAATAAGCEDVAIMAWMLARRGERGAALVVARANHRPAMIAAGTIDDVGRANHDVYAALRDSDGRDWLRRVAAQQALVTRLGWRCVVPHECGGNYLSPSRGVRLDAHHAHAGMPARYTVVDVSGRHHENQGRYTDVDAAIDHALALEAERIAELAVEGVEIVDTRDDVIVTAVKLGGEWIIVATPEPSDEPEPIPPAELSRYTTLDGLPLAG